MRAVTHPTDLEDRVVSALAEGARTRSELARTLGVSRSTLGRALTTLIERGYVSTGGRIPLAHGAGRPVELLRVERSVAYACGIDVTRKEASGVIVNRLGEEMLTVRCAPHADESFAARAVRMSDQLHARGEEAGLTLDGLYRVGVGVPVPVTKLTGELDASGVARAISATWGAPVLLDNALRMVAVGEAEISPSRGEGCLIYVGLGVGVGACVLFDGQPVRGAGALAGELGHLPIPGYVQPCYCGGIGCLETVVGLHALTAAAGVKDAQELPGISGVTAEQAVAKAADAAAFALLPLVLALSPERVVIGGEVAHVVPSIVRAICERLNRRMPSRLEWSVEVCPARRDVTERARGALAGALFESKAGRE